MADSPLTVLLEILEEDQQDSRITPELRNQVKDVSNELESLQEFSREASKNPCALKRLVKKIRDIVFEAQDIVDEYVVDLDKYKFGSTIRRMIGHPISDLSSKLSDLARKIEPIKSKVDGIRYSQDVCHRGKTPKKALIIEEQVVGFEDKAQKVINQLIKGTEALEVISIVGMSGVGKTTLAHMVFHSPLIESEFYNRIWVYVSQDCNIKKVFLAILGQITRVTDDLRNMSEESLAKEIYRSFEKEKYLIVMDDVWTQKDWNSLQIAFPRKKKKSRVLMTTCFNNVAKHAGPKVEPLLLLTPDESWRLFQRKVFGLATCPEGLVDYGKQIVEQCGGLPLAIVVIGGILLEKGAKVVDWREVSENVKGYISQDLADTMHWRIYQLPHHLKACLIYFGMFPKGYEIPVTKLICLWIAEGLVEQKQGMDLEHIAEDYLKDLVNMNLVMEKDNHKSNGKMRTCYVHDMIHEYCKKKACEENFHHEIKQSGQKNHGGHHFMCRSLFIPHNSLNQKSSNQTSLKDYGSRIRSLLCETSLNKTLPDDHRRDQHVYHTLGAFRLLRVLDGGFLCFSDEVPKDLAELVNLRYLYLKGYFKIIPKEITFRLRNLQTLIVKTPHTTTKIEGDIRKMSQLRHLQTHGHAFLLSTDRASSKEEDSLMENLRTLSFISPESCTQEILGRTPKLNKLGIRGELAKLFEVTADGQSLFDNVKELNELEDLKMDNVVDDAAARIVTSLPERFPPNLKSLKLSGTQLDWEHMSTLWNLECLQILKLENNAFKGQLWRITDGGFPQLQVLLIIKHSDLASWEALASHFPKLRSLHLRHCTSLRQVPSELANISSLQTMELYHTTKEAADSAKNARRERGRGFKLTIYPSDHDN